MVIKMILDKEVQIPVSTCSKYYEQLGYNIPKHINSKGKYVYSFGEYFTVKIEDLQEGSHVNVNVKCDICEKEKQVQYKFYCNTIKKEKIYRCKECSYIKKKQTCLEKYGFENPMSNKNIRKKQQQTMVQKYGVNTPIKSEVIKEKIKKTNLIRYGYEYPKSNEYIKEKGILTLFKNYGVDNPMKSQEIKNRLIQTNLEKFGKKYAIQSDEVRKKVKESLYKNGTCQISKQQLHICELYNGILNYPLQYYNLDILVDNNIDIEYDGGGHNLQVKFGNLTEEEFNKKQVIRNVYVKRQGYYIIRLISSTDKLPSDEILLKILSLSKEYFNTTNHTWIEWYFDENKFRNADNIEGTFYDFGKLRKISA